MITSLERTLNFIKGNKVDKIPFHPIIMRFAAKYSGVKYSDFCLDYKAKCYAMIKCAEDFDIDWVTVMSDPYAEAEAFGMKFEFPEDDLPKPIDHLIKEINDIDKLSLLNVKDHARMMNRVHEIEEYKRLVGDKYFIVGWVEGPLAEYVDIRGLADACLDLFDYPEKIAQANDIIIENAKRFATAQIEAGAHCIGIGDAACSQIGPRLYKKMFFEGEKELVDHIHSLGALAKLHICGNTAKILPGMIKTGADIIDIDHMVGSMEPFADLLGSEQVFSGSSDPVSIIQDGTENIITESTISCHNQAKGRCIVSAGCEITPETSLDNFRSFQNSVGEVST
jgi:MtaA/CmuA family methyltransferase